jgi:integrase
MPGWTIFNKQEVIEGELSIYRIRYDDGREPPNWYYELRDGRKRIRKTTKQSGIAEAIRFAQQRFYERKGLQTAGLDPDNRTFKQVAEEYLEDLNLLKSEEVCSNSKYVAHESTISNYLIPYFFESLIDQISADEVEKFVEWRRRDKRSVMDIEKNKKKSAKARREWLKSGDIDWLYRHKGVEERIERQKTRVPSPTTLNNQLTVLRAVFKFAKRRKYVKHVPEIENVPLRKINARPAFTKQEMEHLIECAHSKIEAGGEAFGSTRHYRMMFYYFIAIAYLTGLRTTEQLVLSYRDVQQSPDGGTYIWVRGDVEGARKTGYRQMKVGGGVGKLVSEIREASDFSNDDDYIFVHPKGSKLAGKRILDFKTAWDALTKETGLQFDRQGKKRTLYCTRHTHITQMLQSRAISIYQLSQNVGNSPEVIRRFYGKGTVFEDVDAAAFLKL